ncbi:1-acyl-sn-glycerol-3-phosphate acyltransferase [Haloactinopolyspora alba]|uniref:1-acyl-sn-glycerol-3-phosphate acyltransferase n=1 Tax=Haloactinopolyspora alba TaxID=648780 RepID=A0A2P8DFR8_9ACTN|nr:lysophospholipid acyltransferase family protein [Haloactinopolyspora alba]PSK96060.1 1-acyl-sn-glycerol-3-phosphate acyltransferase [Haloactinopolyspora alba]
MSQRASLKNELRMLRHGRDWRGRSTVPRSADPWVPESRPREFSNHWARTKGAVAARAVLRGGLLRPVTWSQTAPVVEGVDHLENVSGPVVFIANHSSHLDTPLIVGSLPKRFADRLAVGAAADYFFDARWRAFTSALFFNTFPVERYGSGRQRSRTVELLEQNWSLLLFPEGTRSEDGTMGVFKAGVAQLCVANQVPVVPVALRGAYMAMPRGRNWPVPGRPKVAVRYGRPLYPAEGEGFRELRDRMTRAVARLANEEDVGWYRAMRSEVDRTLPVPTRRAESDEVSRWRRTWESTRPLEDRTRRRVWTW